VRDDVRPAEPGDLETWDARVVEAPGGHVYQSRAWARHRERVGWRPRFLVAGDLPVLVLERPWRWIGGGSAYIARGPAPIAEAGASAAALLSVARWLAVHGIDVIAADPEVGSETSFSTTIRDAGFRQIEELQPSRHRIDVDLPIDGDAEAVFKTFSSTTRNLIRQAEKQGLVVRRLDRRAGSGETVSPDDEQRLLDELYAILRETAARRQFGIAGPRTFHSWTREALEGGHLFALAVQNESQTVAGATFYRHGDRVTYALSGERADARKAHPGAARLLLWRAMEIAMAEGRQTFDLGGVDVRGARRKPVQGEPEHGMLQFKESLGGHWVDLAGAHEVVIRPARYLLGRAIDRLARR
jgi:lipid II:glycine glycyltransferase (peptidoglycan interpeptide bridge formation enzyme)